MKMFCQQYMSVGAGGGGSRQPTLSQSGPQCGCCGRTGHGKKDCRQKECICHRCDKVGHLGYLCQADKGAGGKTIQNHQNPKKKNVNGPAPKPTPTQSSPPNPNQPLHQDDWFCSYHHCQKPQLATSKVCTHCQTPKKKDPKAVGTSPLVAKVDLTIKDKKLIDMAGSPPADGAAAVSIEEVEKQKLEVEKEKKYLEGLQKQQEIAIQFDHPKEQIEERAAEIKKLQQKEATKISKSTADLATSELTHEQTFQREDKKLKEEEAKAEEAVRMTLINQEERLKEEVERSKLQQEKIKESFTRFHADEVEKLKKIKATRAEMEKTHLASMTQLKNARVKASGGEEAQTTAQPAEGNVLVELPAGMALISPHQLNRGGIESRLLALAQPGQLIHGISPDQLTVIMNLMLGIMEETAVVPEPFEPPSPDKGAGSSGTVPAQSSSAAAAEVRVPKRFAARSASENGTGEAFQKEPRLVVAGDAEDKDPDMSEKGQD